MWDLFSHCCKNKYKKKSCPVLQWNTETCLQPPAVQLTDLFRCLQTESIWDIHNNGIFMIILPDLWYNTSHRTPRVERVQKECWDYLVLHPALRIPKSLLRDTYLICTYKLSLITFHIPLNSVFFHVINHPLIIYCYCLSQLVFVLLATETNITIFYLSVVFAFHIWSSLSLEYFLLLQLRSCFKQNHL